MAKTNGKVFASRRRYEQEEVVWSSAVVSSGGENVGEGGGGEGVYGALKNSQRLLPKKSKKITVRHAGMRWPGLQHAICNMQVQGPPRGREAWRSSRRTYHRSWDLVKLFDLEVARCYSHRGSLLFTCSLQDTLQATYRLPALAYKPPVGCTYCTYLVHQVASRPQALRWCREPTQVLMSGRAGRID